MPVDRRVWFWLAGMAVGACGGDDQNPASDRDRDAAANAGQNGTVGGDPGSTPLRRLTKTEYINSVRSLLGDTFGIAEKVPGEPVRTGFDNGGDLFSISVPLVEQLMTLADQLSAKVDPTKLGGCQAADGEPACARAFVGKVGPRAYRRPLEAAETDDLVALYTKIRATSDHLTSLRAVLTRMLVSPDFLYHVELGTAPPSDGSSPPVTPFELASRISYLFWEDMPDDDLTNAAASGALGDRAKVAAQIDRVLADPRTKETFWHMNQQWLELERLADLVKDGEAYPGFDASKDDVLLGTRKFLDDVIFAGTGSLDALLTAPFTYTNGAVSNLYGLGTSGAEFVRVDQDPTQRVGILGQPALLATLGKADKSAPLLRGVFVRDRLLCSPVPPPPPGASTIPADAPPAKTTREFFTQLTAPVDCQACHSSINPIGFGFENFDGIGRYRTTENGQPIDATGKLSTGDAQGEFVGSVELAKKLAQSQSVRECVTRQWFRFAYGRVDALTDAEVVKGVTDRFVSGGSVIRTLPNELAKAEPFFRLHFTLQPSKGGT